MNQLTYTVTELSDHRRSVFFEGAITEESDFEVLTSLDGSGELSFDLSGIERINSCGVREWIHFVRRLGDARQSFELVRCSPAIVRQLNMITNFRGPGLVKSVMLPYFCTTCRHEHLTSLDIQADVEPEIADELPCPKCGGVMEFDDLPSTYVSFLKRPS